MPKRQFEEGGPSPPPKRGHAEQHGSCSSESESSAAREEQRQERHYIVRPDDRFDGERYRVIKQLGKGTFGRVVEMWDEQDQRSVAVKVVRAVEKYYREAEIEADILLKVQSGAASDLPIGRLARTFSCREHYCLVFDKLGPSLYHALRDIKREAERHSRGKALHAGRFFSLAQIARVGLDCFQALAHLHAIKLAHTDLKPENILFTAPGRCAAAAPAAAPAATVAPHPRRFGYLASAPPLRTPCNSHAVPPARAHRRPHALRPCSPGRTCSGARRACASSTSAAPRGSTSTTPPSCARASTAPPR